MGYAVDGARAARVGIDNTIPQEAETGSKWRLFVEKIQASARNSTKNSTNSRINYGYVV